jgi:hypothetical protein
VATRQGAGDEPSTTQVPAVDARPDDTLVVPIVAPSPPEDPPG